MSLSWVFLDGNSESATFKVASKPSRKGPALERIGCSGADRPEKTSAFTSKSRLRLLGLQERCRLAVEDGIAWRGEFTQHTLQDAKVRERRGEFGLY